MKYFVLVLLFISLPTLAATDTNNVKLQILDKINATNNELIVKLDEKIIYQDLEIKLKRCRKSGAQEKDENLALLEIYDIAENTPREQVFYGWMFSSSPAISAMEHPIYDVIVLSCED